MSSQKRNNIECIEGAAEDTSFWPLGGSSVVWAAPTTKAPRLPIKDRIPGSDSAACSHLKTCRRLRPERRSLADGEEAKEVAGCGIGGRSPHCGLRQVSSALLLEKSQSTLTPLSACSTIPRNTMYRVLIGDHSER
jgi:hypothetical protein